MKMKKYIPLLLMLALMAGTVACSAKKDLAESTNEAAGTTTEYPLTGFARLAASGIVHIELAQGPVESVRVVESPNPNLLTKVEKRGDELYIYTKALKKNLNINGGESPVAYVTMRNIAGIDLRGATHLSTSSLQTGDLTVSVSGATKLKADNLHSDNLKMTCSGASDMNISKAEFGKLKMTCSGASKMAATLRGDDVDIDNSGASKADLTVDARVMEMDNSGASKSNIRFKGRRLQVSNTGAGKIDIDTDCEELSATNSGAAKFTIKGTADKTDIQASGVSKINTSGLNRF